HCVRAVLACLVRHPATADLYTLSLHDALPIFAAQFADDGLDAGAAHADAGADRVDVAIARVDGDLRALAGLAHGAADDDRAVVRSEEHTSELQSRENLVCRLLLEKKKKTNDSG